MVAVFMPLIVLQDERNSPHLFGSNEQSHRSVGQCPKLRIQEEEEKEEE
jgi:hypothetical protein